MLFGVGAIFGYVEFQLEEPRSHSAVAETDCTIYAFSRPLLEKWVNYQIQGTVNFSQGLVFYCLLSVCPQRAVKYSISSRIQVPCDQREALVSMHPVVTIRSVVYSEMFTNDL